MPGLVLDLQSDALDSSVRCSDLLRKALVVSRKLDVANIENWIRSELNGYDEHSEIPEYRRINGSLKVWNPYRGWQPLYFEDPKEAGYLSSNKSGQPIGELESLVNGDTNGFLQIHFPPEIESRLVRGMKIPMQPSLHVSQTQVIGIIDAVRNTVLEWTLELEQKGIFGEGMSFSKEEKRAASNVTYQITHNIGTMQHSQIQHDSPNASQIMHGDSSLSSIADFLNLLSNARDELELQASASAELDAEIATLETQLASPRPKQPIINEALRSVRNILEGVAGSSIASGLLATLAALL